MSETYEQFLKARQSINPAKSGLSEHHIDLWEHGEHNDQFDLEIKPSRANMILTGCLLFSAFEWQAAADLFAELSHAISIDLYSTVCLLNASMIYARLGEFSTASQALAEAENVEELLPITLFLMGHVEYELDNLEKSEDCFNVALEALASYQGFNHLGLNYVLQEELIQENLATLQTPSLGTVATIPGDVIFEAPPRTTLSRTASHRSTEQWSGTSMAISDAHSSRSLPAVSMTAPLVPRIQLHKSESEKHRGTAKPQIIDPGSRNNVLAGPLTSRKDKLIANYTKLRAVGRKVIAQRHSTKKAPGTKLADTIEVRVIPAKQIQRMQARDARPGGNTTANLSAFIKGLPKQNQLVAREPRGRPGSTGGLAEFFRGTGPKDPQAATDMISRVFIDSLPLSELKTLEAAGLQCTSERTTLSCMSRHSTPQTDLLNFEDRKSLPSSVNGLKAPQQAHMEYSMAERPVTAKSDNSWQSRDRSDVKPAKMPQRFQPEAIHPARRPGFLLN